MSWAISMGDGSGLAAAFSFSARNSAASKSRHLAPAQSRVGLQENDGFVIRPIGGHHGPTATVDHLVPDGRRQCVHLVCVDRSLPGRSRRVADHGRSRWWPTPAPALARSATHDRTAEASRSATDVRDPPGPTCAVQDEVDLAVVVDFTRPRSAAHTSYNFVKTSRTGFVKCLTASPRTL